MSDAAVLRHPRTLPLGLVLILIPLASAVVGLAIRYLAFAATVPDASIASFAQGMCRWDCPWYVKLSESGYDPFPVPTMINAGNWAFFPLYPILVAIVRTLTGLETIVAATGLSLLIAIASARVAWPLLGKDLRAYTLFSVFLAAGPFSIWFTTFYTEVLFLFLTLCVFAALQKQQFLLAGLFAALLSATRIVGVFIVFAILIEIWQAHRANGGSWRDFVPAVLRRPNYLLALCIAPLGLFAYMAYLHFHIGDALAFSHVQRAWARPTGNPLVFVWNALTSFPKQGWAPTPSQQLAVAVLVGYALSIVLLVQRRYGMAVYSLICLTLPLFAGMASVLRFTAALAPMPLLLTELLASRRWLFATALLVLLVGGYVTTIGWLTGYLSLV
ncbi:MAG TPA: hypothetical protein VGV07_13830 [Devosia sp.]|jgi:hypothetical protein|uniref:hypothetical protein n=1 Tax=Devosia sp. TaxID=1871048 RepID=UPI002DDD12DF|nr:hypothetical protein [Devosia sp.]HEV2516329.1 hypothetical protein [Devosia sp.]